MKLGLLAKIFLNNQVRVDAAEAKTAQGRAARHAGTAARPRLGFFQNAEWAISQVQALSRVFKIRRGRNLAMFKRQKQLGQAGRAGGCETMTDVGLDRAEHTAVMTSLGISPKRFQAAEFFGVAHRRAGGVALNGVDVGRLQAALFVGRPHGPKLTFRTGCQKRARDIVGQAHRSQHAQNAVAVSHSIV